MYTHPCDIFWPLLACVYRLSGHGYGGELLESFVTAIKSVFPNLRELELSGNILGYAVSSVFSDGLGNLEKLR